MHDHIPMKIRILGCGPSGGVPWATGNWGHCNPKNPKNQRSRTSALIEVKGLNILIDASPDFRFQALREGITRIDAVIITHAHADHILGLDELRRFNMTQKKPIPIYADPVTMERVQQTFPYMFSSFEALYPAFLEAHVIEEENFSIQSVPVTLFAQLHGHQHSSGVRIGNVAYSTDVKEFPENSLKHLQNLSVWFVDCLREKPHPTHAHKDLALTWIKTFAPEKAVLIHMTELLDYETLSKPLPQNVIVGFDGMVINV